MPENPNFSHREEMLVPQFFSIGMQYYVSARVAGLSGFIPVTGNLAHHAVEMFLKGHLSRTMDEKLLKRVGHNLEKAWAEFKRCVANPKLIAHDRTIAEISAFEEIRYPHNIVKTGMVATINSGKRVSGQPDPTSPVGVPLFNLTIGELDELMKDICRAASINPIFYTQSFRPSVKQMLLDANAEGSFWVTT
jgi:hypothetical protein